MTRLTAIETESIIRFRGVRSEKDGRAHPISILVIHHKDRNPENNDPKNLKVLTKKEHGESHKL